MKKRILYLLTIIPLAITTYGCSEELANKTAEQAKLLQSHISTIAAACTGKISVSTTLTGDMKKPSTTTITCSEMDKKHKYFKELTDKDLEEIKTNVKKLN